MSLTSLESAPVLSVIGDTSTMVCKIRNNICITIHSRCI